MIDEDVAKLREELETAKAASAFLYLALDKVAALSIELPRLVGEATKGRQKPEDIVAISKLMDDISETLQNAKQCIWDEDGKPR